MFIFPGMLVGGWILSSFPAPLSPLLLLGVTAKTMLPALRPLAQAEAHVKRGLKFPLDLLLEGEIGSQNYVEF